MADIGKSSESLNDDVQVAEPPKHKKFWQWAPLLLGALRFGWDLFKDLVLKK